MKKILMILGVLAMSAGAFAEDSYLYWMVGDNTTKPGSSESFVYNCAKVSYVDDKGQTDYLNLYLGDGYSVGRVVSGDYISAYQTAGMGFYAKLVESTAYSSFVVELFNDSTFVAQSEVLNYGSAQAYIAMNGIGTPANMVWAPTSYAVPEPNSALMLLLGSAVLALRRRKQV